METHWAMEEHGDTGVAETDGVTRGVYSGDPEVESLYRIFYLVSYLISYHLLISE
jgi:hypothetical protein